MSVLDDPVFVFAVIIFLFTTLLVGQTLLTEVTSPEAQAYFNETQEWCEERNGTLVSVHSFAHGGLHCDLPNGTSVHMYEVIE